MKAIYGLAKLLYSLHQKENNQEVSKHPEDNLEEEKVEVKESKGTSNFE